MDQPGSKAGLLLAGPEGGFNPKELQGLPKRWRQACGAGAKHAQIGNCSHGHGVCHNAENRMMHACRLCNVASNGYQHQACCIHSVR